MAAIIEKSKDVLIHPGIFMPVLVNRFRVNVSSQEFPDDMFDGITLQTISLSVTDSPSPLLSRFGIANYHIFNLILEVDTGGLIVKEYNKLKSSIFDLSVDNLDGNDQTFHKEIYKNCTITNTSWFHDYAVSACLKLILTVSCESIDFELVNPMTYKAKLPLVKLEATEKPKRTRKKKLDK
jgi:hypothetical protein